MRTRRIFAAALFIGACTLLVSATYSAPSQKGNRWVGTWATSPFLADAGNTPPAPGFKDSTLRQIVHVSIGGRQIRVRFSNAFGASPLTISSAHVAVSSSGSAIRRETDKPLTFHGELSVTIPPGALMYSDPLDFGLAPLSDLAVTIHLVGAPDGVTSHLNSRATSYLQAGDLVSAAEMPTAEHTDNWYFLNGVDVLAANASAIVAFGDSITAGSKSTTNANARWPDELARRLQANKSTANIGVINEGIGGNRLLHDGTGPNALARMDRDVLAMSGVRWLIVLEGVNDLGTRTSKPNEQPATVPELIAAYEQIILRAHAHDIRVYGVTILPFEEAFYYRADLEPDRQKINNWIRTSGKFDAVIDLDAVTRDPQNPAHFSAAADSGDHLHPGDTGYKMMADAIDLKLFAK